PSDSSLIREWNSRANLHPELTVLALLVVVFNLPLLTGDVAYSFAFSPGAVLAGEWWRIFTHPFVHVSPYHLLLDATAFFIAYAELRERRWFERLGFVAASGAASLLAAWYGSPLVATHGLCGLSGIAHGLSVLVGLEMISRYSDRLVQLTGLICFC